MCRRSEKVNSDGSVEEWNESMCSMINQVSALTIPQKIPSKAWISVPWWNKDGGAEFCARNVSYRNLRLYSIESSEVDNKKLCAVARNVINGAKQECWRKYCGEIGGRYISG